MNNGSWKQSLVSKQNLYRGNDKPQPKIEENTQAYNEGAKKKSCPKNSHKCDTRDSKKATTSFERGNRNSNLNSTKYPIQTSRNEFACVNLSATE